MNNIKLIETVADISYIAGFKKHYSGNSRLDISEYILWAKEFEQLNKDTDWDCDDYMLAIEKYANEKIKQSINDQFVIN
ncbi:MAG: hypothetical protein PHT07_22470 [Paludibacter sp.]|nr:hypothetical protein [Paludibacter sp.]